MVAATIIHGDARHLPLADCTVDAVICDPPYELTSGSGSGGFMGKKWDATGVAFDPATWREALRVLKPGGFLLAFGGMRTQHRLICAIEDAGFDIRDAIVWHFASGFPKSLDVGKAIDKANGRRFEDRYALGQHIRERREAAGLTRAQVNHLLGATKKCEHYESDSPGFARVPTIADWRTLRDHLHLSDEYAGLVERAEAEREVIGTKRAAPGVAFTTHGPTELPVTVPATDDARRWQGFGTALKPASEIICVARKPLAGKTVAQNVLAYGCGALNIDGCRVGYEPADMQARTARTGGNAGRAYGAANGVRLSGGELAPVNPAGRWPSNVVFSHPPRLDVDGQVIGDACADGCVDGCPVLDLDTQSGVTASGVRRPNDSTPTGNGHTHGAMAGLATARGFADTGTASRFFPTFRYQAKAPSRERPKVNGVAHPVLRLRADLTDEQRAHVLAELTKAGVDVP